MTQEKQKDCILQGRASLGIELGSTRIKAVLIGDDFATLASGEYCWNNKLEAGFWTYDIDHVWTGLQEVFASLRENVRVQYGVVLKNLCSIGISAMMHGYLAFDAQDNLLVPFRTWRNTNTEEAAALLTEKFQFNIPIRWNVSHLCQAILDGEEHVKDIDYATTLAGYVHWQLTGEKVLGIGDASGMFPIDSATARYNKEMVNAFDRDIASKFDWKMEDVFPKVLLAGEDAGRLTQKGAQLLDPTGLLQSGIPMSAPEGDAGTGMVATNSIAPLTGNVSAGTSIFAMVVLEKELSALHTEIDMVTTPSGKPVAMVHCNNCTSDLDAWVELFAQYNQLMGFDVDMTTLYKRLYEESLNADPSCGGLLSFNFLSGEPIAEIEKGRPLFVRKPDSDFSIGNFMRNLLFSSVATLAIGMQTLANEGIKLEKMLGHGGFFKTPVVGQRIMAAALDVPVEVMDSAGEGGAWGSAVLASYLVNKIDGESLDVFLAERVFVDNKSVLLMPNTEDQQGFVQYLADYQKGLAIEKEALGWA